MPAAAATAAAAAATSASPTFCDNAPVSTTVSLAALGIISLETRRALRDGIRATWLADFEALGMGARFVLRGVDLMTPELTLAEARSGGDMVFVRTKASYDKAVGPVTSLMLWYKCAARIFPEAQFVGKADDDVWLEPGGWSALLASLARQVSSRGLPAYIGQMEGFHWRNEAESPVGWDYGPLRKSCRANSNYSFVDYGPTERVSGPFNFARGSVFFLSASLARYVFFVFAYLIAFTPHKLSAERNEAGPEAPAGGHKTRGWGEEPGHRRNQEIVLLLILFACTLTLC